MKRKHKISFFILATLLIGLYLADRFYFSQKPILYPNFGITIPSGYNTHGIDVSRYQNNIDWDLVSKMSDKGQRISFAIIKATEGTTITDSKFCRNWENIKEVNLIRGAYLYFHPNKSGAAQAKYFINKVKLDSGDLPPVIDIEETNGMSKEKIKNSLQECIDVLEKEYEAKPIIYASVDFYDAHLGDAFDDYPLWAAHYERNNAPRIEREWTIWQHNCKGHVNGINAEVDFNVVNGSIYTLKGLCL